jgi:hypothetical protein
MFITYNVRHYIYYLRKNKKFFGGTPENFNSENFSYPLRLWRKGLGWGFAPTVPFGLKTTALWAVV